MRQIDGQLLVAKFFAVRQMTRNQRNDGHLVNEKRNRRLIRIMSLMPIWLKSNTSEPVTGHDLSNPVSKGAMRRLRSRCSNGYFM
ncbi:MAG: hypothetical protein AAGF94_15930 [Pseudomonadota bacterium]